MVHPQGKTTTARAVKLTDETAAWLLDRVEDATSVQRTSTHSASSRELPLCEEDIGGLPGLQDELEDPMNWGFHFGLVE